MVKSYRNPESGSKLILADGGENVRSTRNEEYFKVLWNRDVPVMFKLDPQEMTLGRNELICLMPLQELELSDLTGEYYLLPFNREFYCIHENDNEVACEGLLF